MATNDFYKNWTWQSDPISADDDTIDYLMRNEKFEAQKPSMSDMESAQEWLALYGSQTTDDPRFQSFVNVIAFLDLQMKTQWKRERLAQAKREYAREHGIKISQVRVCKADAK